MSRSHKGDPNFKTPFSVVEVAKQREALALLEDQIFSDKPFQFPARVVQLSGVERAGTIGERTRPSEPICRCMK